MRGEGRQPAHHRGAGMQRTAMLSPQGVFDFWLKAREQHENRVEGAWRRDKLLNRCRGLLELIQQELVKRGETIKELRRRHRICAR